MTHCRHACSVIHAPTRFCASAYWNGTQEATRSTTMVPAISAHSQTIQLASSIDATAVATKQSSDTASENASVRM